VQRRASSSEPKISSSTKSDSGWPARSAIICEMASRSTRLAIVLLAARDDRLRNTALEDR